jgi:hypothetical protein
MRDGQSGSAEEMGLASCPPPSFKNLHSSGLLGALFSACLVAQSLLLAPDRAHGRCPGFPTPNCVVSEVTLSSSHLYGMNILSIPFPNVARLVRTWVTAWWGSLREPGRRMRGLTAFL